MIQDIKIMNRFNVQNFVYGLTKPPSSKFALISISNLDDVLIDAKAEEKLKECGCISVLPLQFTDITSEERYKKLLAKYKKSMKLFDLSDAEKIIDFVKEIHNRDEKMDLIIHCQAGISRSGAVGLFTSKYLKIPFFDPHIDPNPYVYGMLMTLSGLSKPFA